MKKWEQLQLTLGNSKSEDGQSDYKEKTQNLFKTVRVQVTECEFLEVFLRRSKWDSFISGMSSTRAYMKFDSFSIQVVKIKLCL